MIPLKFFYGPSKAFEPSKNILFSFKYNWEISISFQFQLKLSNTKNSKLKFSSFLSHIFLTFLDSFREVRSGNSNKGNRERRDSNNKANASEPNSAKDKGRRSNNQQNLNANKDLHHHHHQQGPRSPKWWPLMTAYRYIRFPTQTQTLTSPHHPPMIFHHGKPTVFTEPTVYFLNTTQSPITMPFISNPPPPLPPNHHQQNRPQLFFHNVVPPNLNRWSFIML